MNRITRQQLEHLVSRINEVTGSPVESWTRDEKGFRANIGNYHLSGAYGGVGLEQMVSDGGGVRTIFGYTTKRELYAQMRAFLDGNSSRRAA